MVDYKSIKTIEQQDKELEELWAEFYDVPIDPDKGTIEDDFLVLSEISWRQFRNASLSKRFDCGSN